LYPAVNNGVNNFLKTKSITMKNSKLNLSFARYSDDAFATKGTSIYQMMLGNPAFPSPVPPLADVKAALDAYQAALIDAVTKDKVKVIAKKEARQALETVLLQLGYCVQYLANGNDTVLASSGFDLSKQPEPVMLEQPGMVTVSSGITAGELVARMKKVRGAYSYLHQITPDPYTPDSVWESAPTLASSNTFSDLMTGKKYWFRVGAVGSGSQLAFSPLTCQVAQ
jgi:hypothetical protein